ncbi:MAG TPA: EcsC family protein [Microlunatus sp.]|nr:EcsC family protein [Microlunatus sp.]
MPSAQEFGRSIARTLEPIRTQGPVAAGGVLRAVVAAAIDGLGRLPDAKHAAAKHLTRAGGDVDAAIETVIESHIALGSAQGFVTNLGGLATLPVALPANLTGIAVVQVRMVAAIAHLRGYDLDDPRVRTALVMCLLGGEQVAKRIANGKFPTSPLAVATAPVFDPELDDAVAQAVVAGLAASVGGRNLALLLTKRIPLIGGGVGAVMDGVATHQIGKYAKSELVPRRAIHA